MRFLKGSKGPLFHEDGCSMFREEPLPTSPHYYNTFLCLDHENENIEAVHCFHEVTVNSPQNSYNPWASSQLRSSYGFLHLLPFRRVAIAEQKKTKESRSQNFSIKAFENVGCRIQGLKYMP